MGVAPENAVVFEDALPRDGADSVVRDLAELLGSSVA